MDAHELERRRRVWEALSDMFLDTETRWYFPRIALELVRSGYSREELDRIFRNERVPECGPNLLSVAGEWAVLPLDETALLKRAEHRTLGDRLNSALLTPFLANEWSAVLDLRALLERLPPGERPAHVAAGSAFAHLYLERSLEKVLFLESKLTALRDSGLDCEQLLADFEGAFRPIYRTLLLGDERDDESARAANVREAIEQAFGPLG